MKSFTDIEQSMKLAEILPRESADMTWVDYGYCKRILPKDDVDANAYPIIIPAWSLAALLDVLPSGKVLIHDKDTSKYKCICKNIDTNFWDNAVDTCYEMIIKLNELNLW